MNHSIPAAHSDPWVNVLHDYVTQAVRALAIGGLQVDRSWLDPRNPRDATIIFSHPASNVSAGKLALVWDEVSGWRRGIFESGRQGVRTVLSDARYLGGGVLLDGPGLVARVLAEAAEPHAVYRSAESVRDGLDDALLGSHLPSETD